MVLSCSHGRSRAYSSLSQAGPGAVHDPAMSTWSARTGLARDRRRPESFVEPMLATPVQGVPTGREKVAIRECLAPDGTWEEVQESCRSGKSRCREMKRR